MLFPTRQTAYMGKNENKTISVSVACGLASRQAIYRLSLPQGSTVSDALTASGTLATFAEISRSQLKVGIFGKLVSPDKLLREGDRVEVYRPLSADPKQVRIKRARRESARKR